MIFVEEPIHDPGREAHWERHTPEANVLVARPHTPVSTPGFCDERVWLYLATGVERGEPAPEDGEEIELVRIRVEELESRIGEIEDAKTLTGVLLLLRER